MALPTENTRLDKLEKKLDDVSENVNKILSTLGGDGLSSVGFVHEVRTRLDDHYTRIKVIEKSQLTPKQIDAILKVVDLFQGWKAVAIFTTTMGVAISWAIYLITQII
jgi:hypothetical protein